MGSSNWFRLFLAFNLGASASTVHGAQLSPRACTRTVKAKQGDTCASLANSQGISVSEFLLDNPTITSCDLTAGNEYCVAEDSTGTPPPPALTISTDGTCGNGVTCAGSKWGTCCSEHGYCGSTDAYCGAGCQAEFGSCGAGSPGSTTTPPAGTGTVVVTATTVVTRTSTITATKTTTVAAPATATVTSVVLTTSTVVRTAPTSTVLVTATSVVTRTAASTAVVTYTSLVYATATSVVLSTSLVTRTATSLVLGTATVTVTDVRTAATTTVTMGACSPTKPDTPITITRTSPTPTPTSNAPSPLFPGTVSTCKKYHQIRASDTCDSIVGTNRITFAQFYRWNPSVGSNAVNTILCVPGLLQLLIDGLCKVSCDALWEGYYVCVSA